MGSLAVAPLVKYMILLNLRSPPLGTIRCSQMFADVLRYASLPVPDSHKPPETSAGPTTDGQSPEFSSVLGYVSEEND